MSRVALHSPPIFPHTLKMTHRFTMARRVEFADTDLAGIVHFANFFRYMEATEHAFFRSLGHSVHPGGDGDDELAGTGWPRVNVSCEYRAPIGFEEEVEIELLIEEVRTKSIRYLYRFWKSNGEKKTLAATGRMTSVCVKMGDSGEGMKAVSIPAVIREKIEAAPPEALEVD